VGIVIANRYSKMTVMKFKEIRQQFDEWLSDAQEKESEYAEAMSLATATKSGMPSVRIVLLKALDDRGFVFYTNLNSQKGRELSENPNAALCFHWKSVNKQIRVEGTVSAVDFAEADYYFASRPRASQIGAWASKQSQPIKDRFEFEKRIAKYTSKFNLGNIPRPDFWSGFRLNPNRIEFWHEKKFRLHERNVYLVNGDIWRKEKVFP
jgi:pyridoxamine 5'-phosphate oxidase